MESQLSFSGLPRGSFCDEVWSHGALTIALTELKSEHACAITVKSTAAVKINAIRETLRFATDLHFGTVSTVDTFSAHVKKFWSYRTASAPGSVTRKDVKPVPVETELSRCIYSCDNVRFSCCLRRP